MKSKFTPIYTIFFVLIIGFLFLGNSSTPDNPENPPNGYTGAPGDNGLCTSCHTPGNPLGFDGQVIIENFPTNITPNTAYPMTIRVTNPNGLAFRGGFQAVVLDENNVDAGDLTVSGSNPTTQTSNGREYVEHNPAKNFPGSNQVTWDFTWISPSGPIGEMITMYAAGNIASGGNGNQQDLIVTATASGTIVGGGQMLEVEIVSSENVSCFGGNDGSATASASGGTTPYIYNWSNGSNGPTANNLTAGTHTVTVTDATNATATAMVTITQPPALIATIISQTNITCDNPVGSATAAGTGGTPPYTYNWSSGGSGPTETFLNPGTYTVTVVDGNLCVDTETVTITQNTTPPIAEAGPNGQLDCDTPILVLNGSGSSVGAQFTYLWTTDDGNIVSGHTTLNPTVNEPGTYTLTVTNQNNGCTASDNTMVIEIPDMTLFISGIDVSCFGGDDGSINLTITGGQAPFEYNWNDNSLDGIEDPSGLSAGNYCVTVTDAADCMETTCIEIQEPAQIVLVASANDVSCVGSCDGSIDLSVSGGSPGYSYSWVGPNNYTSNNQNINNLCPGVYSVTVTDTENCTATTTATVNEPAAISISAAITNASCDGSCDGSIDLSVSGGTPGYTYLWNGNQTTQDISNLCAGSYTVTVTDSNNCSASAGFTVSDPAAISITATINDATCNGGCDGSIALSVSGGTPGYTYLWEDDQTTATITNLCAGDYTVTVTDNNGCTGTATFAVGQPAALVLQLSSTNESSQGANDGTATAEVSGGTPGYTYLWDDPANQTTATAVNLAPGTYCVTVTDANDCTITGCVVVNAGGCDLEATVNTLDVNCNGGNDGQAEAIPTGGTEPYTYNWSSGGNAAIETNLSAGSYSVTITDANNCEVIVNFTINEPPVLELEVTGMDESGNGAMDGTATATVTGGTSPYSYLWDDVNNSTTPTIENLSAGTYCVTVTDANGCTASGCVDVNPGSCDLEATISVENVSCNGEDDGSAAVTASGGTPPYTYSWTSGGTEATEDSLSAGSYMVTIFDSNGCCIILNFEVTEPELLEATASSTPTTCEGACDGSINLNISGGTPGYAFSWSNGQSSEDIEDLCAGTYSVTVTDANGCTVIIQTTVEEPPALDLTLSSTDETAEDANDGTATAEVTGGTGGYEYVWDTNPAQTTAAISGLAPGTYCVTVTDANGCTTSGCTIVNPFGCAISLEISNDNVTCVDNCNGTIDLTVIGGEAPFSYEWSSTSIGNVEDPTMLCFGDYSVTVTDNNGCSATISTSVEELPDDIVLSFAATVQSCLDVCDGAFDLAVSGGASPYTYLWSNGETTEDIDSLCFQLYQVTVTDANGCSKVGTPVIQEPSFISIFDEVFDISCFGDCTGSIDITVTDAELPVDYDWSDDTLDGIEDPTNLCPGIYELTVTDVNGCSASVSVFIGEPTAFLITGSITDASCFEACDGSVFINFTGGTPPYSFSGPFEQLCAGAYAITATDANGCTSLLEFDIDQPAELVVSIDEIGHEMNSQSDGFVNITVAGGTPGYSFDWLLGGFSVSADEDPTGLSAGNYTLEVTDANGCLLLREGIIVDNITGIVDRDLKSSINIFPNPTNGLVQIEFDLNERQFVEIEVFDFTGKKILEHSERNVFNQSLTVDLKSYAEGVYTIKINVEDAFLVERIIKHD